MINIVKLKNSLVKEKHTNSELMVTKLRKGSTHFRLGAADFQIFRQNISIKYLIGEKFKIGENAKNIFEPDVNKWEKMPNKFKIKI